MNNIGQRTQSWYILNAQLALTALIGKPPKQHTIIGHMFSEEIANHIYKIDNSIVWWSSNYLSVYSTVYSQLNKEILDNKEQNAKVHLTQQSWKNNGPPTWKQKK